MEKIVLALLLSGNCLTLVASDAACAAKVEDTTKAQDAALSSAADSGICADVEDNDGDLGASVIAANPGHVDADKADAAAALSTLSLADKKDDALAAADAAKTQEELAEAGKKETDKEEADL